MSIYLYDFLASIYAAAVGVCRRSTHSVYSTTTTNPPAGRSVNQIRVTFAAVATALRSTRTILCQRICISQRHASIGRDVIKPSGSRSSTWAPPGTVGGMSISGCIDGTTAFGNKSVALVVICCVVVSDVPRHLSIETRQMPVAAVAAARRRSIWRHRNYSRRLMRRLKLRFDFDSTLIRWAFERAFDCLSKVIKCTVT